MQGVQRQDVNEIWIIFKELLLKNVMENVPEKQDNRKKKGKWLSKVTLKRMKERNTAWKKYRQFKSGKNFEEYRSLRNEVTTMIEMMKITTGSYYSRFQREAKEILWIYERHADGQRKCSITQQRRWETYRIRSRVCRPIGDLL